MPDENRVFDVSRPSKVSPPATSRPVIVGHHPIMNDPMVRGEHNFGSEGAEPPTKIPITDADLTVGEAMSAGTSDSNAANPQEYSADHASPAVFSDPAEQPDDRAPIIPEANHPESVAHGPFTDADLASAAAEPEPELPQPAAHSEPHIEGLHFPPPQRRRSRLKLALLGLLLLIIAGYLLIDSGAIGSGIKLPFHIFKQKTQTVSTPPAQNQPTVSAPSLPAGFKEYKLSGTNLTFAAPIAWGDPTSTTDPGYSKRSAGAQSDGTYAYLVNFATNKDIQVAVTSSKFLPTARTPQYYDYLQWCTGSSDGKIYESILNFSTAAKVDTPTTITCNQGPIAGAVKIDTSTIIQAQAKDSAGKVMGDIYTKNLNDPALVVFRVKDAAMTSGSDIKQLLNTVKITASQSSSATSQ